jgi:undecaprenyl pyrophosphate synthase
MIKAVFNHGQQTVVQSIVCADVQRLLLRLVLLLLQDKDAEQWGAELRVIGDLTRAPVSVQKMAARLMQSSKDQQREARAVINLCFCYT